MADARTTISGFVEALSDSDQAAAARSIFREKYPNSFWVDFGALRNMSATYNAPEDIAACSVSVSVCKKCQEQTPHSGDTLLRTCPPAFHSYSCAEQCRDAQEPCCCEGH